MLEKQNTHCKMEFNRTCTSEGATTHPTVEPANSNCTVTEEPAGPAARLIGSTTSVRFERATRSKLGADLSGENAERVYCAVGKGALTSRTASVATFIANIANKTLTKVVNFANCRMASVREAV